ncbi:MAG: Yip1 family protein [Nitrososphaerales archaeon]
MGTINRAIALVRNPVGFMTSDRDAPATVRSIMINYVAVLAAIPFFATLIGDLWYYSLLGGYAGIFIGFAFVSAVLTYILDVIAVYVIGFVIQLLASNFGTAKDQVKSLKLSAYVFTPVFLISVLNIIPLLGILTILGVLYGLYILYMGLPIVLGTAKDRVVPYLVTIVVVTLIVYFVIAVIIGAVTAAIFATTFGIF